MTVAPHQKPDPGAPLYPPAPAPDRYGAASSPYPTAPPWAAAPPVATAPPAAAPVAPHQPEPYRYGQLLVPYPEEMAAATRPAPPSWVPVVIYTLLFGFWALISVGLRAGRARRGRNSVAPYWIAWGVTMVVGTIVSIALVVSVAVPAYLNYREQAVTKLVQSNIETDAQLKRSSGLTVTDATCTPKAARGEDGLRRYDCALTLDDGRTGTLQVTADSDGHWKLSPAK